MAAVLGNEILDLGFRRVVQLVAADEVVAQLAFRTVGSLAVRGRLGDDAFLGAVAVDFCHGEVERGARNMVMGEATGARARDRDLEQRVDVAVGDRSERRVGSRHDEVTSMRGSEVVAFEEERRSFKPLGVSMKEEGTSRCKRQTSAVTM